MAQSLGDAVLELRTDDRKLRSGLRSAESGAQRLNSVFKTVAVSVAAAFSVRAVVNFGREIVNLASAAEETANKFNVVFGTSAAGARAELEELTETIPLTLSQMQTMAAGVQDLLVPMGVVREEAAGMSVDILRLAGDIASFNDVDATRVLDAIRSGLAGSSEPLLRFGIDTRVASLEALAFEEGLIGLGEELDNTARAQAVMLAIQRDSTDAIGDAARTVDSTANSMRFLGRETLQLREDLGEFLLPTVGVLAGQLSEVTANLREFAATAEGQQFAEDLADAVGDLTGELVELFDILQELRPLVAVVFTLFEAQLNTFRILARVVEAATTPLRIAESVLRRFNQEVRNIPRIRGGLSGLFPSQAEFRIAELTNEELVAMGENAGAASKATADLEGRLEELDAAGVAAERRLEALNEQHRANLRAIRDNLEIQENFADAIRMATEEMASQASTARVLQDALDDIEIPDVTEIFEAPDASESRRAVMEFGRLLEEVMDDVGRALAQAIISGDVQNAVEGLARSLEAAFADALARAVGDALSGQGTAGFADALTLGITATLFAAFTKTGPFREVEVTVRSITAQMDEFGLVLLDLGEASDAASRSLSALSAAETEIFSRLQASVSEVLTQLGVEIPQAFERFTFSIKEVLEDGVSQGFQVDIDLGAMGDEGAARTRLAGEIERTFETLEEAIGFATREFLRDLIDQGVAIDEAVRQLVQGEDVPLSAFQEAVTRVQSLADQALMSLDGVSALEIELRKLPAQLQQLAGELRTLGLSSDQVTRLVGGQLVASMQALRQQITGEQLSVEQRREIAEANAELFNAELELQIARLEAERDALIAEAGIAQQEAALNSNVIDARSRFVQAQSDINRAELGVMEGFIQGAGTVIQAGVRLIGDTAFALGDALGALPEEIRRQVEAIQKVIDALRRIGTISPGDIRIPGIGVTPSPGPVGGGGPGPTPGPGIDDAAREAREELDRLIRSLDELASETIRNIDVLEGAVGGLEALRDEIALTTQAAPQQLETVRSRLLEAAARFQAGDVSAAADIQAIGRQFAQLVGEQFSPAAPGFRSNQRFLQRILDQTIDSGEEQLATERDLLDSLNERQADLLEQLVDLGELTEEEIEEIRQRGEEQTAATRSVEDRVGEMARQIDKLARAVEQLARQAAKAA